MGSVPDSIPPGASAKIPVEYKPGFQSGRKDAAFRIATDSAENPAIRLGVVASLFAEVEVLSVPGSGHSLRVGKPGRQAVRVISRRLGDSGRKAPLAVEAPPPIIAHFDGPAIEKAIGGRMIESSVEVSIELPTSPTPGMRREVLSIRWEHDLTWSHPIAWQVAPALKAAPSTLLVPQEKSDSPFEILIKSDDRPFRITAVTGDLLARPCPPPPGRAMIQTLHLVLDGSRPFAGPPPDVIITTDHPDQPTIALKLAIVPQERGVSDAMSR